MKKKTGQVALKTLIVIHRTLREGDAAFREELLGYRRNGHALRMSNFKDDSSPQGYIKHLHCNLHAFLLVNCFAS